MKDDANIKVPRAPYERTKAFALNNGRDIREVVGVAMDEYVRHDLTCTSRTSQTCSCVLDEVKK